MAQSSAITSTAALLSTRNPSAEAAASALANSISGSGVFYESHLSRWLQGSYPLAKLWQEPQAWMGLSFRPSPQPQAAFSPLLAAWRSLLLERPGSSASGLSPRSDGNAGSTASAASAAPRGGAPATSSSAPAGAYRADGTQVAARPAGGVTAVSPPLGGGQAMLGDDRVAPRQVHQLSHQPPEHLQSLVRHQLELMASPTLRWEGQLLPGMPMFFMLTEVPYRESHEQSEGSGEREQAQRQWRGEIRLTLPRLGEIEVELESVAADHWRIVIAASDAQARQRIAEELPALREQLIARQLRVDLEMTEEKLA
ncbi:flagellar hook-length control protein FliK [Salinicola tamaricis]|uniref:flagellar hook-length control protein FliK n=1 Tax=Salinicola tamaricis TaxID=1771309 RepID=UPI00101ADA97|nr:flagellar hook-length control protein FliK [Salinicola tamaricis]